MKSNYYLLLIRDKVKRTGYLFLPLGTGTINAGSESDFKLQSTRLVTLPTVIAKCLTVTFADCRIFCHDCNVFAFN